MSSVPGCASLAHGRYQEIAITSEPPGAEVFIDRRPVGVTPLQLDVSRRHAHVLRFEKEGFAKQAVELKRRESAWLIADIAVAANPAAGQGLDDPSKWPLFVAQTLAIVLGIDLLTGAAFTLPSRVSATLQPVR
jgi:hypothetical protein